MDQTPDQENQDLLNGIRRMVAPSAPEPEPLVLGVQERVVDDQAILDQIDPLVDPDLPERAAHFAALRTEAGLEVTPVEDNPPNPETDGSDEISQIEPGLLSMDPAFEELVREEVSRQLDLRIRAVLRDELATLLGVTKSPDPAKG